MAFYFLAFFFVKLDCFRLKIYCVFTPTRDRQSQVFLLACSDQPIKVKQLVPSLLCDWLLDLGAVNFES